MRLKVISLMLLTLGAAAPLYASNANMNDKSDEIADMSNTVSGDKAALNDNIIKPFISGGNIKTYDGKTDVSANMMCEGSNKFLQLFVQPAANGDLKILTVKQDLDMDGNIDSFTSPGWNAAMICANGFLSCRDANDMNTCKSYTWTASKSNVIGVQETGFGDMGGCYCVTGACGYNLVWNNLETIMNNVGAGMSAALAKNNPYFSMSKMSIEGTEATVYGSDSSTCNTANLTAYYGDAGADIKNYRGNPNKMKNDGEDARETSGGYNAILTGSLNPNETSDIKTCTVTRTTPINTLTLNDIITYSSGSGGIIPCGDDCLQLNFGRIADNNLPGKNCQIYRFDSSFYIKRPDRIKKATLKKAFFDDWIQLSLGGKYYWSPNDEWTSLTDKPPARCERWTNWKLTPNFDMGSAFSAKGRLDVTLRVAVEDLGEGYILANVYADTSCEEAENDLISDTCTPYQDDTDCKLMEEDIDGVKTFFDGAITGLVPTQQSKIIGSGSMCSLTVSRPWFKKTRKYRCKRRTDHDLSKVYDRSKYVKDNVDYDNKTYKDKQYTNNGVKYSSGDLVLPDVKSVPECINVCKTKKLREMPVIGIKGTNKINKNPEQYDISYNECTLDEKCPVGNGEEVVTPCQCVNQFAEATAIMQVLRMAGQDMICSSGVQKLPEKENMN